MCDSNLLCGTSQTRNVRFISHKKWIITLCVSTKSFFLCLWLVGPDSLARHVALMKLWQKAESKNWQTFTRRLPLPLIAALVEGVDRFVASTTKICCWLLEFELILSTQEFIVEQWRNEWTFRSDKREITRTISKHVGVYAWEEFEERTESDEVGKSFFLCTIEENSTKERERQQDREVEKTRKKEKMPSFWYF